MTVLPILTQPETVEWHTPPELFRTLDKEFGFTLDAAANAGNALCDRWWGVDDNGLQQDWSSDIVWCNPPYGGALGDWTGKGYWAGRKTTVVMLIPARTDTSWWHRWVMKASEIRLIAGRLRFSGAAVNAPFPSAVVVFSPLSETPQWLSINRDGAPFSEQLVMASA